MKRYLSKNTNRILLIVALLPVAACSDFLEGDNPSALDLETFYTTSAHAEQALIGVYADTRFMSESAGSISINYFMLDAVTGTTNTQNGQNLDQNNLLGLSYDANTVHILNWWTGLYRTIMDANIVIEKVPPITPMDPALKNRILGEARFLRAWAYFYAVRMWGDIPMPLQTTDDVYLERTSQETVYNQIVEDLKVAEESGLPWMDATGRVSTAAAKALLAKVYLTMAGNPLNKGTSHYQLASDKAKEVIDYANANPLQINLFSTYGEIHHVDQENKLEHLFEIQYHAVVTQNDQLTSLLLPVGKPIALINPGGGEVPTLSFYNSFEPGDLRTRNREGYFYTSYFRNGSIANDTIQLDAPFIFKHFDIVAVGSPNIAGTRTCNLNIPQIRYAEVLLIYAEAQNEVSGPTQAAYDAFKRIRDRALLTTQELGVYTKETFREAVWKERWHELCFENITWFDMVRLKKVLNEQTKGFDNFEGHVNLNTSATLQARHLLFPLPGSEILNNPSLRPQNPGYGDI